MKKMENMFLGILILALCVLLFLERFTGGIVHAVLGVLLIVVVGVHLARHNAKMKYRSRTIQCIDWALVALLAVLFVTGMLLHPFQGVLALKILHKLAAVLFVLGILAHILQHRKSRK